MSPEVFISYSRNGQEKVCRVAEKLKAHGLKIWIDHQGIEGATRWSEEIVTALEGAKVMVFLPVAMPLLPKTLPVNWRWPPNRTRTFSLSFWSKLKSSFHEVSAGRHPALGCEPGFCG